MELSYREKIMKYGVYCAVLAVAGLLQNVFAPRLEIFGARCFIVLPVAVIIALSESELAAALLGLFGGVMMELFSAQQSGYSAIFLMLFCFFISALVEFLFRNNFWFCMISCAAAIIFYLLLYWLLFVFAVSGEGAGHALVRFYLPGMLYTMAVAPLLYPALIPLQNKLNKRVIHEN